MRSLPVLAANRPKTPQLMPKLNKRARRRLIKTTLVFGNAALLLVVGAFVFTNRTASQTVRRSTSSSASQTASAALNPLDQLSSAEIAVQAAQMVKLDELTAVRNQADSENAQLAIVPNDSSIVAKPQIISTAQKSKRSIQNYKTAVGDTISGIATKFGVDANSIRYSNSLTGDSIDADKDILIPPGVGIVYTVKAGDTIDTVTSKFQADKNLFITVNDAEGGSLAVGDHLWIPNGVQPVVVSRYIPTGFAWGSTAVYNSNGYDYGFCTWYVSNRRAEIGRPVPSNLGNAYTWYIIARNAGLPTGLQPLVGAVAVNQAGNHVEVVEAVNADGSFWVSEMNSRGQVSMTNPAPAGGWGRKDFKLVTSVGNLKFIY